MCEISFGNNDQDEGITISEFQQLVALICPSIPEGRILEVPRLLKLEATAPIPFRLLFPSFCIHFYFYDSLLALKHIFVVPSVCTLNPEGKRRTEWRAVTLLELQQRIQSDSISNGIPFGFIEQTYANTPTLTFDELIFRLLTNHLLALTIKQNHAGDCGWHIRDDHEVRSLVVC
jgi:hypothetical protein